MESTMASGNFTRRPFICGDTEGKLMVVQEIAAGARCADSMG